MDANVDQDARFKEIIDTIEDGYFEADLGGRLSFCNVAFERMTGYTNKELIGVNLDRFFSSDCFQKLKLTVQDVLQTGTNAKAIHLQLIKSDGAVCFIETPISLIKRQNSKIAVGFRGLIRDITEHKTIERNLLDSYIKIKNAKAVTILALAKLAEYRDDDTGRHLERIREYVRIIAKEMACNSNYADYINDEYIEDLYQSSILHDIGKVGVPDAILLQPSKLTAVEFEVVKQHSVIGGDALSAVEN